MKKYYIAFLFFCLSFSVYSQFSPTGTSAEVGITQGSLSVSPIGSANYEIPIAVPPGINGVAPKIALFYNSNGGNGVAGYGWNLSGISKITRIPSTKLHDGFVDPVDFDASDRFSIDGQRLLVKSGTSGVYGSNETIYETENYSNLKITSYGISSIGANYGPSYFTVQYPDGSVAQYGGTPESTTKLNYSILFWQNAQGVRITYNYSSGGYGSNQISSIKYGSTYQNTNINEINFEYRTRVNTENGYYGGQDIHNMDILDKIRVKGSGVGFRNYYLNYDTTSLGYQRLISITEKTGDDTVSYNPTVFTYDTTVNTDLFDVQQSVDISLSDVDSVKYENIPGDFDGDGAMDLLLYRKTGADAMAKYWVYTNLQGIMQTVEHNIGDFRTIFPSIQLFGEQASGYKIIPKQGWTAVKYNAGDNVTTFSNYTYSSAASGIIESQYTKSYSFPRFLFSYNNGCPPAAGFQVNINKYVPKDYISGDFNGDGLTDTFVIEKDVSYTISTCNTYNYIAPGGKTYFVNLDKRNTTNFVNIAGTIIRTDDSKFIVADYNGDGKSDLFVFNTNTLKVYSLKENNELLLIVDIYNENTIDMSMPLLVGDYNGDKKADFIIPRAINQDMWRCWISNGNNNFNYTERPFGFPYIETKTGNFPEYGITSNTTSLKEMTYVANDINGDGKTDIIIQQNITAVCVYTQNGCDYSYDGVPEAFKLSLVENHWGSSNFFQYVDTTPQLTTISRYPIPVFTNQNQLNENLQYSLITMDKVYSFTSKKDNRVDVLLKQITVGNGVKQSIFYSPLKNIACGSNCNPVYTTTPYTENYPNTDIVSASTYKVVSKLELQCASTYRKQLFAYYDAVSNFEDLGFLGFKSVMRTNWHDLNNTNIISYVSKNDVNLRGATIEEFAVLGLYIPDHNATPGTFISKRTTINNLNSSGIYEQPLQSNKVFKIKPYKKQEFNGLENTETTLEMQYDIYNNPISSVTTTKEGSITVQKVEDSFTYDNQPLAPTYILGRLAGKTQQITTYPGSSDQDVIKSEEIRSYTNNLLTQVKSKENNSVYILEDNLFDAYGNLTKKTITAPGLDPRVTAFEYDMSAPNYGRFLTANADGEGLIKKFTYEPSTGILKSQIDPYLNVTNFAYDKWNKQIEITDYLGKKKTIAFTKSAGKTITTITAEDLSASNATFDELGREIQTGVKNINGTWSYTSKLYDVNDRNYKISEPYFIGQTLQWNETQFDAYGRISKIIPYTQDNTILTYSGLSITENHNTTAGTPPTNTIVNTKSYVKNALGKVISLTESPGGTITYVYFADGNLKSTKYNGTTTAITQDAWGRKTSIDDPSAGIINYEYNHFGELTKETVVNKSVTTYDIDKFGKLNFKTIVGLNGDPTNSKTSYTYDPNSKLLSTCKFQDFTGGFTINYTYGYDLKKRLVSKDESGPQAHYQQSVEFDAYGRPYKELHTAINVSSNERSDKWITYSYKNGYQFQIRDGATGSGAILRQINSVNAWGQVLNASSGAFTAETRAYSSFGYPSQISYKVSSGPYSSTTSFLELNYSYNPQRGTLSFRNSLNMLGVIYDNFTYDTLDRLIQYPNETGALINQTYDDKGNITSNSGIGTYAYTDNSHPYRATSVTFANPSPSLTYYTGREQNITYNGFKSPITIKEENKENIDFEYNAFEQRSAMYYGSTATDKWTRPYRKYYSADGTMEIKRDMTTGKTEFITYIGGDGYTAPLVFKKDANGEANLFLHRDNQGSILAITSEMGQLLEKRAFDAWGALIKYGNLAGATNVPVRTGAMLLDRGYTGHEQLLGVGLINMNARLYDPKLHRFLSPDNNIQNPLNTQNYNRYGYAMNNPLRYTDPSGEDYCNCAEDEGSWQYESHGKIDPDQFTAFMKDAGNFMSNNLKSIGNWFDSNWKSITRSFNSGYSGEVIHMPGGSASFLSDSGNGNEFTYIQSNVMYNNNPLGAVIKIEDYYNQGLYDRSNEIIKFFQQPLNPYVNVARAGMISKKIVGSATDILFERTLMNPSKEYMEEVRTNVSKMTVYDWSYAAGYATPDIAIAMAVPYAVEGAVFGIDAAIYRMQSFESLFELKSVTVLGHYPEYVELANTLGARRFQIPSEIWEGMSPFEQWGANAKFLERTILRGDLVRLATPINAVRAGSSYAWELEYMFRGGFIESSNSLWLIRK